MASSKKRRTVEDDHEEEEDTNGMEQDGDLGEDNDSDDDATDESENEFMDQEVQVEFEAQTPADSDFHGIKMLLQQLFLKSNVNVSDLTDIIISQNYVGSVLKQVDEEEDTDCDDDSSDDNVYGLVTAINITDKKDKECIQQLRSLLKSHCQQSAKGDVATAVSALLDDPAPDQQVALLINERFINIPALIALPTFQALREEMEKAVKKKMNFSFTHFVMLCKTYRLKPEMGQASPDVNFLNQEEGFVAEMSDVQVSWSVADEHDNVSEGQWHKEEDMEPLRTLLVFDAKKLDAFIDKMQKELSV